MNIDELLFRSKKQSDKEAGACGPGTLGAEREDTENVAHAQNKPTAGPQLRISLPERPSVLHEVSLTRHPTPTSAA